MRFLVTFLFTFTLLFGADATIEVVKKVDALPSIAVEDASEAFEETTARKFFRMLIGDLNVLALFNVDRHHTRALYEKVGPEHVNKGFDYVLRYRLSEGDGDGFNAQIKLIHGENVMYQKSYKINKRSLYVFLSHAIAYDINNQMGADPVDWIKRKVVLTRLTEPQNSEIVIADYSLTYKHVMIKGGLNVFPKWANEAQDAFYYTSLSGKKPTLYKMDTQTGKSRMLLASDGMMICSDVRDDGKKLLLTMAPEGQPDVYLYDVESAKYERMTRYSGIDVNAQFMEDDRIVFVSNRLGYPNVFSKKIGATSVDQMVYYGKSNAACSAHNEYVVYKARESANEFSHNTFNLHLISTKTDFIRRLTATGINEFPRFSRDGDAILFIKNYKQQSSIGVIRLRHNKNFLFPLKIGKLQSIDW